MEFMELPSTPNNIEEAIDTLIDFFVDVEFAAKNSSEDFFLVSSHMSAGMFIRNSWYLWWSEKNALNNKDWPQTKPPLNKWFNDNGITHPDDMSSIIFTCLYRKLNGRPYNIDKQIEKHKNFWKESGYPDGIPK